MAPSTRRGALGVAAVIAIAGCGAPATPTADAGGSNTQHAPVPAGDERIDDEPELVGEADAWELTGFSPDGRLLTLATTGGGCSSFQGWVSEETPARVHIEATWEHSGADACRLLLRIAQVTLQLEQPLGERDLTGCHRHDCLALPDDPYGGPVGPSNHVSAAEDALVVTGNDTVWSLATDGTVRWERPREGYRSLAREGMVLRYDHIDHIELLDAATGETRWDADDVTFAGIDGDQVLVCPREQALDDGPRVSFRGALSLDDGSWLWREDGASCTTGAADRDETEVPDVDLDPARVGRSAAVDLTAHDGVVYVATSTAIIALDEETGERLWWTLLAPPSAVDVGGVHRPTHHDP